MALFEGNTRVEGSRSNTKLIKSGHMSPAEEWLLDPRFLKPATITGGGSNGGQVWIDGVLFNYRYGGPGMEEVVIPKGRVVGVDTPVKDFVSKKFRTVLTLPGLALNNNTIGMVPYNICKDQLQLDRFGGNQPAIITLDYVTLPYIPSYTPKAMNIQGMLEEEKELTIQERMPWGAVVGKVEVGDYVKATPSGRLTKWEKGTDDACDIVGQVLACDLNGEEWGWRKWMLWTASEIQEDEGYLHRFGVLPGDEGYGYQHGYVDGDMIYQHVHSNALTSPTGIPGLHDGSGNYKGYGINETEFTDIELGEMIDVTAPDTKIVYFAKDFAGGHLKNLQEGVEVKVNGAPVDASKIEINHEKGLITITAQPGDFTVGNKVTATYKAYRYGVDSYLDYKGVEGAMFVLLKK